MTQSTQAPTTNLGLDERFQYPPDLLEQLIDTIPLLVRSKKAVVLFFKGAGASRYDTQDIEDELTRDRDGVNKFQIARSILTRLNQRGDVALAVRREVIKRVVEFEDFSVCWETDQQKARGQVAEIRRVVNVHDSFTRIAREREQEATQRREEHAARLTVVKARDAKVENVKQRLFALFGESDPHRRGLALEPVLNDLFATYGILIRESFKMVGDRGEGVVEQIDGVIELDGHIYLVEMKWHSSNLGTPEVSPHLVRLFGREGARGLIIANPGYSGPAIKIVREALRSRAVVLATLHEFVAVLTRGDDLAEMLRQKVRAAVIDREPLVDTVQ